MLTLGITAMQANDNWNESWFGWMWSYVLEVMRELLDISRVLKNVEWLIF